VKQVASAPHQHLATSVTVHVEDGRSREEHQVLHPARPAREHRHLDAGGGSRQGPGAERQRDVERDPRLRAEGDDAHRDEWCVQFDRAVVVGVGGDGGARAGEKRDTLETGIEGRLGGEAGGNPWTLPALLVDQHDRPGHRVEDDLEVTVAVHVGQRRFHRHTAPHGRQQPGSDRTDLEGAPARKQRAARVGGPARTDGPRGAEIFANQVRSDDDVDGSVAVDVSDGRCGHDLRAVPLPVEISLQRDGEAVDEAGVAAPHVDPSVERADDDLDPGASVQIDEHGPGKDPALDAFLWRGLPGG